MKNMSTSNLLNEEIIYEALKDVYDPEIPVNIVDLGLVYDPSAKLGVGGLKLSVYF